MESLNQNSQLTVDTATAWEAYWNKNSKSSLAVPWDTIPEEAAATDLPRFKKLMNPELPLIDFACGNGTQTRFLANHFPNVIGVDVSKSAIEVARLQNNAPNIKYMVLNGLVTEEAAALHSEIGDANIYMRTGLHHIPKHKRHDFAKSLQILLGKQGILYMIELDMGGHDQVHSIANCNELSLVFEQGLRPGSIQAEDIAELFSRFQVISSGQDTINGSIITWENGDSAKNRVPAFYTIIKHQ